MMQHPIAIYTAQMRVSVTDELDITIKSASTVVGKALAPTWEMVNGYKSGAMSEAEYRQLYVRLLRERYKWDKHKHAIHNALKTQRSITLKCYCPADTFCHRLIAKDVLMRIGEHIGVVVCDGGEITQLTRR